jgi:hypothetical protein
MKFGVRAHFSNNSGAEHILGQSTSRNKSIGNRYFVRPLVRRAACGITNGARQKSALTPN